MTHPLAGVRLKLDRGDEHVNALQEHLHRLSKEDPPVVRVREEVDLDAKEISVVIQSVSGLPLALGLTIGDAIHNYRSALDQLIFELAFVDSGGIEQTKTAFPASITIDNFRGSYVQGVMLKGLTQKHRAMLKRFQPYRTRKAARHLHPLSVLEDLSNDDKHRLIQPALFCPEDMSVAFPRGGIGRDCRLDARRRLHVFSVFGSPLYPNTPLFRIPVEVTGPNPQMHVKCYARFFVGLRNGVPVDGALVAIGRMAREIVEALAPEFETKKALRVRDKPRVGRFEDMPPEGRLRITVKVHQSSDDATSEQHPSSSR